MAGVSEEINRRLFAWRMEVISIVGLWQDIFAFQDWEVLLTPEIPESSLVSFKTRP
jgi:hypothetical protein